ncbi:alpha/beta fold hydrolase [Streptomyces sp. NPDC005181]|uniref:thioesterase II family protein n=1 Tax=Streptomyces sp. NPDC005181 TaxID=3156869 RepID=UPI0033B4B3DE
MSSNTAGRWLRRFHPSPEAAVRLAILPHAGGSASFYFPFSEALSGAVEVLAVQYPGRQERSREPGITDLMQLADRITEALTAEADDRPTALFGHSMGAMLAFEVASRLQSAGAAVPVLFTSGRRAPSRHRDMESVHTFTDTRLVAELKELDGTDSELLDDPNVLSMVLPAIRSDYEAVETYRYQPQPKLFCPVMALVGDSDPRVDLDEARAWADHTAHSFELRVFPGGHFYLSAQRTAVVEAVKQRLAASALLGIAGVTVRTTTRQSTN